MNDSEKRKRIRLMIKIDYPKNKVTTRQRTGINEVFDAIRKKWLLLTPEEWVRQNVVQFLLINKKYPASLIAVEKEIKLGELKKRCDLVVYNRDLLPWMIIECKEMNVPLTKKVLEQVLRYHITLPATYLIITNGSYSVGFQKSGNQFSEMNEFPDF
ncbi:MAG: type I restriction enzyme HsdR N-terminal domain-containing protein [Ginsengibacter sp.]